MDLGNPWPFSASRIAAALNWLLSLMLNFTSRLSKSIWMVSCSTHGRVPSALRTRVGQPTAQVIPGTRRVTSDNAPLAPFSALSPEDGDGAGVGASCDLPHPGRPTASAANATTDRNSLRMEGVSNWRDVRPSRVANKKEPPSPENDNKSEGEPGNDFRRPRPISLHVDGVEGPPQEQEGNADENRRQPTRYPGCCSTPR